MSISPALVVNQLESNDTDKALMLLKMHACENNLLLYSDYLALLENEKKYDAAHWLWKHLLRLGLRPYISPALREIFWYNINRMKTAEKEPSVRELLYLD